MDTTESTKKFEEISLCAIEKANSFIIGAVGNRELSIFLDTGASTSLIKKTVLEELEPAYVETTDKYSTIRDVSGKLITTGGLYWVYLNVGGQVIKTPCVTVSSEINFEDDLDKSFFLQTPLGMKKIDTRTKAI